MNYQTTTIPNQITPSTKFGSWHGIARETIPWFPTVNHAKCKGRPFDIVNLKLEVSTLKGALEKTPSHMNFEVTSTEQQDITGFLNEVRSLIRENQLVLANENRV